MNPRPLMRIWSVVASSLLFLCSSHCLAADDASKVDPRYPFRTDFANAGLPWYQPKPSEFPPHHSDHRVSGELVSADFIRRMGQFRTTKSGELVDFTLPPYGSIIYLNAEADLRDIPLGTFFLFFLHQDSQGNFTRLATMQDQYSMDAGHSFSYRLDALKLDEGKLLTTKQSLPKSQPDLGKKELLVTDRTQVWKDDQQLKLADLAVGDELLFNLTGKTAQSPGICTDIWVGSDTHKLTTEQQRKKNAAFVKFRGLPAWVEKSDGNKLTVNLFSGDSKSFQQTHLGDFGVGKEVCVVVANEELRTWNPPTDKERGSLLEIQKTSTDGYGASGVQLTVTVPNMLEGFRRGRVVRLFGPGWPIKDQFYGESLMGYGYGRLLNSEVIEMTPKEYAVQFPFRTDYSNDHLPWYKLQSDELPPRYSEHIIFGELIKADAEHRSGQFRTDRTGELVDFTLLSVATVRHMNADAKLSDLPLGTRCRFSMFQDPSGKFTLASHVSDEYSYLASNALTYRIELLRLAEGKLNVARQMPEVKNYNGDMEKPHDIGHSELLVNADTRVWKGEEQVKLSDLAVDDVLLVNLTGEQLGKPSHCSDIWVGAETHKLIAEKQKQKK
jgi:hypothetical protein